MNPITLSCEDRRAVIDVLRAKGLPYLRQHADHIERHGPDEPLVTLSLTDDVYLCSSNGARLELGIPLPPMQQ